MRAVPTRFSGWWSRRDPMMRLLPSYLWRAVQNFARDGLRASAALAYYAIFSIFPLTLLLAVGISRLVGPAVAQEQIAFALSYFLPAQTSALLRENLIIALEQGASFGVLAVVGLLWSGLGLFSNIAFALDLIFDVPSSRSLWRQRLIAGAMAGVIIGLVGASFVTGGVLRLLSALLLQRPNVWLVIGTTFLPLGLSMVIFALLFRFVPARHVTWDAVWPAAIFGALGWEGIRYVFVWYITNSITNFQFVYGGITVVILLLFYTYLSGAVFLLAAEICARLNEWFIMVQDQQRAQRLFGRSARPHLPSLPQLPR